MEYDVKKSEPIIMSGKRIDVIDPTTLRVGGVYKKYDHWEHEWITFEVLKPINRCMQTLDGDYSIYDINITNVDKEKQEPKKCWECDQIIKKADSKKHYKKGILKEHWIGYWFDVVKVN